VEVEVAIVLVRVESVVDEDCKLCEGLKEIVVVIVDWVVPRTLVAALEGGGGGGGAAHVLDVPSNPAEGVVERPDDVGEGKVV